MDGVGVLSFGKRSLPSSLSSARSPVQELSPLKIVTCSRSAVVKTEADEITLPSSLELEEGLSVDCFALVDCGATRNFIDFNFCKRHDIPLLALDLPISLRLADGSKPPSGRIEKYALVPLRVRDEFCEVECLVTWLNPA